MAAPPPPGRPGPTRTFAAACCCWSTIARPTPSTIFRPPFGSTNSFSQGHYWLGRAYRATGDLGNAERQLRRAVELDSAYYEARLFLGRVLNERAKPDEARTLWQALVGEAPAANQWRVEAEQELARLP